MSSFSELTSLYDDFSIDPSLQITESDIYSLQNVTTKDELRMRIENIKDRFQKINEEMRKIETQTIQKYNYELKELLQQNTEQKERQLEMLEFFKDIGFDLIAQDKTNTIIDYINQRT